MRQEAPDIIYPGQPLPPPVQLFELLRPYFKVERIWYNMKPGATNGLEVWEVNIPWIKSVECDQESKIIIKRYDVMEAN